MEWADLNEHTGTLVALLGLCAGLVGLLFWRMLTRIETKTDDFCRWIQGFMEACGNCKVAQATTFATKGETKTIEDNLWQAVNHHAHDKNGRVTRT